MFQDETEHVKGRICLRKIDHSINKSDTSTPESTPTPWTLSTSVEHQASCFFVQNYVLASSGSAKGHLDHIPQLAGASGNEPLVVTLTAVGLAGLANFKNDPFTMAAARQKYASALHLTNTILRDPVGVRTDQTLTIVILLSVFETLTCTTHKSIQSWTNHIIGATALLKLRGVDQFQSETGLRLFEMLRVDTLISCLQRGVCVPGDLDILTREEISIRPNAPSSRLSYLVSQFCKFRVLLKEKAVTDHAIIIAMVLEMDAKFAEWVTQLPEGWGYVTINTPNDPEGVYERFYHIYADFWHVRVWNFYRCSRILLNEILLDQLDQLNGSAITPLLDSGTLQAHRHRSHAILSQLASDLCASVPSHLNHANPQPAPAAAGYFMLWPLYIAGAMVYAPESRRLWAIDRLRYIKRTTGIAQATSLANVLNRSGDLSPSDQTPEQSPRIYKDAVGEDDVEAGESEAWKQFLGTPGKYTQS